ncbi:putative WRKY transcription factor 2 [Bidens hawaiensis]|uniref:putative WRKY transcription factor 2 n=1 Tax=Bidens hawaiensis TaxID=980011 RepID=UPI00404A1A6B
MGGFDDHVGIMGDWMAPSPSPSPRSFFLAMLSESGSGSGSGSRSVAEPPKDNPTGGFTFHGPDKQFGSENGPFGEPKAAGSRSGLVERMAARAGYNAPRLNTDIIIRPPADVAKQSSVLTIPPGLSPTSLLDSPVFLSNSLAQPSPTTGKFPFAQNKDDSFEDFNTSSFAFKPVLESTSVSVSNKANPLFMSWQTENLFPPQNVETNKNSNLNENIIQEHHEEDADQITSGENGHYTSEDGYNWRKYGQKQVKGSEYPRSYYKCTYANCPVTKKVERSREGHITEIIYKGAHNHSKPPPGRKSGSNTEWGQDGNLEVSSTAVNHTHVESSDHVDGSLTLSNEEGEDDDRATHGSVSLGGDGDGDESESKRRKIEAYASDVSGASRAIREPRVVVQTTSDVDILDDGYRWRKYGQKVVKGNPNPRSYYKCTSTGCTVRKHVERASHDLKSVITTYEGKHNHDVPVARNSSHVNSTITQPQPVQPSQVQHTVARFERPHYGLQPGPTNGYGYGMNMNLSQMSMVGLGPNGHQFIGQMNEMGMMLPKGEPKVEPVSDHGLNLAASGSSIYHHQIINGMPIGPHM